MWTGFTLRHAPPRRPASYVAARSFTITPSWPLATALVEEPLCFVRVSGDDRGEPSETRNGRREQLPTYRERLGDDGLATDVEDVEEERCEPGATARCVGAEVTHRVLEASRRAVVEHAEHLTVEHEVTAGQRANEIDDAAEAVGHVVEVAGEEPDVVAASVGLDPRPVELPLHGSLAGVADRSRHIGGR